MKYKGVAIGDISIFSTTVVYMALVLLLVKDLFEWLKNFVIKRGLVICAVFISWMIISKVEALQVIQKKCRLSKIFFTLLHIGFY